MENKIVLITGSTDGIGKQTALEIAKAGLTVLLHGRDKARGEAVRREIISKTKNENVNLFVADLSSQYQIHKLAKEISGKYDRLDVLINNAGVFMKNRQTTEDGLEMTFAVNHIAPFLLTYLLLSLLKNGAPSRIINVSSVSHQRAAVDFDNLQSEKRFDGYDAYALSKLGNIFFTYELAEILKDSAITVNAIHPGVINTKLLHTGFSIGGDSVEAGAETSVYMALSDDLKNITGKYFIKKKEMSSSPVSHNIELRKKFWRISQQLTGIE